MPQPSSLNPADTDTRTNKGIIRIIPLGGLDAATKVVVWQHDLDRKALATLGKQGAYPIDDSGFESLADKRYIERMSIRIMLREVYAPQSPPSIDYLSTGRPILDKERSKCLSISHTKGAYALAIGTQPIGIDLECWGTKALRLASRFINAHEASFTPETWQMRDAAQTATLIWSAKEAVYKLLDLPGLPLKDGIILTPGKGFITSGKGLATSGKGFITADIQHKNHTAQAQICIRKYENFVLTCAIIQANNNRHNL